MESRGGNKEGVPLPPVGLGSIAGYRAPAKNDFGAYLSESQWCLHWWYSKCAYFLDWL